MARVTTPTVSIVLGTFNSEKFIGLQIQSILNQTFTDFELLISDDASSDTTPEILKKFARLDRRIRLTLRKRNVGMSENYTQMVERASGTFVAFSDHDDIWRPHKIEQQVHYLQSHPDVDLCYHDSYVIDENSVVTHASLQYFMHGTSFHHSSSKRDTLDKLINTNHILGNSIFCTRQLAISCVPIPHHFSPDYWLVLNAVCFSKIGFIDRKLIQYRIHEENAWRLFYPSFIQKVALLRDRSYAENFVQNLDNNHRILALILNKKPSREIKVLLSNKLDSLWLLLNISKQQRFVHKLQSFWASLFHFVVRSEWTHAQYAIYILMFSLSNIRQR